MRNPKKSQKPLTKRQVDALARHKRHHSKTHMDMMKRLMRNGASFTEAHRVAMTRIGA